MRQTIGKLIKRGFSRRKIAAVIGVNASTVSRELKRNCVRFGYCCHISHQQAKGRRALANRQRAKLDSQARHIVADLLSQKHSPEQIASQFPSLLGRSISMQAIYRYLRSYDATRLGLRKLLRRKGKRYIRRSTRNAVIRNRPSINSRPPEINDRSQYGHWEADLMEGPRHLAGALLVLVERKSRYLIIKHVANKTSAVVSTAISKSLKPFNALSITYDNGVEFANYKDVTAATGAAAFFCHPYHAWEKGTVENSICLLREYHPKKSPIPASAAGHRTTQKQLNLRPRKTLGFNTPNSLLDFILKPIKLTSSQVTGSVAL